MINKLGKSALLEADEKAFRWAIINAVNQVIEAVNVGVVWDNKVDADRKNEAVNVRVDELDVTQSIAFVTLAETGQIDKVTAGEHADVFEEWQENVTYKKGQIRRSNGVLYTYIYEQDVVSVENWRPENTIGVMWEVYNDPNVEWPDWSQPIGAHDAYAFGDKVLHKGIKWVSTEESNVWEPGIYGWREYSENE